MYARTVAGRVLSFGVSGKLLRDGLVMYDRETDTLWTQVDGRAIEGPLAGHTLEPVPSVHATWRQWRATYPGSQVLVKRGLFRSPYESYNRSAGRLGIMGRRNADDRLPGKERIVGIRSDGERKAFPLDAVRAARIVNDRVGSLAVVLAAPDPSSPVAAFDRRVGDRTLRFTLDAADAGTLIDEQTGSRWRASDGVAVDGPLRGRQLERVAAHPAFWFGWQGYFPDSDVWQPAP